MIKAQKEQCPHGLVGGLQLGGNANNGANDGRFYGNWNNTASNADWNIACLHFFWFHVRTKPLRASPLGENYTLETGQ